jgi:hypothetical protein
MNSTTKYGLTLAAAATALALAVGGTSVAVGQITSKDIKDQSIKVKDLKPGTIAKLRGQQGPAGPAGPAGAAGTGAGAGVGQGATTSEVVANNTTPNNPAINNQPVVVVPNVDGGSFSSTDGVALVSVTLPAGHYIVSGTALLFQSVPDSTDPDYGEVRLFAGTTAVGSSIYTPEIPTIAGAQTNANVELNLNAQATITLRALVRSVSGNPSAFGGGNLLVTNAD